MTNEQKRNPNLEELTKMGYAAVAMEFSQSKDGLRQAQRALEHLAEVRGIKPEYINHYIQGSLLSKEGMNVINEEYGKYSSLLGNLTMNDAYTHYSEMLPDKFSGESGTILKELFYKFKDEKYEDIFKKVTKANYALEGENKGIELSKDEKKKAEEISKKYERIHLAVNILEKLKNKGLKTKIENEMDSERLKKVSKPEGELEDAA